MIHFEHLVAESALEALDLASVSADGEEEPLEELLTEACCQALVDTAFVQQSYVEPYPIVDKKSGKKFSESTIASGDAVAPPGCRRE